MKKIFLVFGTRPEAIKMAPVVLRLKEAGIFQVVVAVTGQHRQMLDQVLELFQIFPDYDLDLMTPFQDLFHITVRVLEGLRDIFQQEKPDLVLVQGDTTTTFAAALAAYYLKIPVGHVEAGLRTGDKYRPYPEELNRHLTGVIADYHFAPTPWARDNLLKEGVSPERIWVTGNTVIDALKWIEKKVVAEKETWLQYLSQEYRLKLDESRLLLVTSHRRENFGTGFENICLALRDLAEKYDGLHIIYPVHMNPHVQKLVYEILSPSNRVFAEHSSCWCAEFQGRGRITLLPPLGYALFIFLMSESCVVLTDSGGVQEEAPALGKPVLVMREVTERPEGVWAGTARLVGTGRESIVAGVQELMDDPTSLVALAQAQTPYGDGRAAKRIAGIIQDIQRGAT